MLTYCLINHFHAIWFFTPSDAETGQTAGFTINASGAYNFAIHGNTSGFVAEVGTGTMPTYWANSPVKLYEKVIEMRVP